jgi:hypothetical protein
MYYEKTKIATEVGPSQEVKMTVKSFFLRGKKRDYKLNFNAENNVLRRGRTGRKEN